MFSELGDGQPTSIKIIIRKEKNVYNLFAERFIFVHESSEYVYDLVKLMKIWMYGRKRFGDALSYKEVERNNFAPDKRTDLLPLFLQEPQEAPLHCYLMVGV
jgi:hypothetical protein